LSDLTINRVSVKSLSRCKRWHHDGVKIWSVSDWAVAFAGEAGEVCNAVKKLRRIEDECANINEPGRQLSSRGEAVSKIGDELGDTFLYMVLLAAKLDIDLPAHIAKVFNKKSEEYGFPERLVTADFAPLEPVGSWVSNAGYEH
jgi:NTP pyrophosphatase (non-canonical NTP hydrolase)